jgi:DNA-binding IclR family transcriptional regulator
MASQIASSLDKALGLLFAFTDPDLGARVLTVSALAERSGMDKAQVSRVLATFAKYGVVERLDHRRGYQLGWSVLTLASRALLAQTFSAVYPLLSQLSIDVRESVHFSVRDGATAVTVGAFEPERRLAVRLRTGRPFPLLGSAVGQALLARSTDAEVASIVGDARDLEPHDAQALPSLDEVRSSLAGVRDAGHALVPHELGEDITTIAVPIDDVGNYEGRVYAVVSASAPSERFDAIHGQVLERLTGIAAETNDFLSGRN